MHGSINAWGLASDVMINCPGPPKLMRYRKLPAHRAFDVRAQGTLDSGAITLPLVSREWKNGSNSSYNCTPFLHSLLTKGK